MDSDDSKVELNPIRKLKTLDSVLAVENISYLRILDVRGVRNSDSNNIGISGRFYLNIIFEVYNDGIRKKGVFFLYPRSNFLGSWLTINPLKLVRVFF